MHNFPNYYEARKANLDSGEGFQDQYRGLHAHVIERSLALKM